MTAIVCERLRAFCSQYCLKTTERDKALHIRSDPPILKEYKDIWACYDLFSRGFLLAFYNHICFDMQDSMQEV